MRGAPLGTGGQTCALPIYARHERQPGAFGGLGAFGGAVGPARDQFGRSLHIAAGGGAIAVEQFRLVLHALARGFQLGGDSRSEEHTSELQSLMRISYAVFCLKKKTNQHITRKIASVVRKKH